MTVLNRIKHYSELKGFSTDELRTLASEIREYIVSVVSKTGGHMASSLGAVELTLALLRAFDPGEDRIVFDVGHQTYAYKILTGRRDRFPTLRQWGGISGFPKRSESPYDHFDTGHSSTSLSAALGYAKARDVLGEDNHVVAVIGDASLLNGLAFEALNYTKDSNTKVIYILNDNTMSISPRVGGFATHLARLSSSTAYNSLKKAIKESCSSLPKGQALENALGKLKDHIKSIVKPINVFDEMDINYWGPFDGHNVEEIEYVLELAKKYDKPVLVHLVTVKGKGLEEAEREPTKYHGVPPHAPRPAEPGSVRSWSEAASSAVLELAERDRRIVCLTAAMKCGSKLEAFASRFPERFFDVGIAESHMLTMAAGMAAGGLRPVVFVYSTFLQRAMDQLVHDIAMQNLPVTLAIDRSGLIGDDGETHQGLLDISWLRPIPNLVVTAPRDEVGLQSLFEMAVRYDGPVAIRYPRGTVIPSLRRTRDDSFIDGLPVPEVLEPGEKLALVGYGKTVDLMLEAHEMIVKAGGVPPTVVDLKCVKPLPGSAIESLLHEHELLVVAEDGYKAGGVGEAIATLSKSLQPVGRTTSVVALGIPDLFVSQGTMAQQAEFCGLTPTRVVRMIEEHQKRAHRQGHSVKRAR
ncbi:MAG: 1-deoxy-D-xylulose-5-phosphate synthase [Synergistaceae bacterium]|nr:1-deoxy-D-xylulose-5-phosphate synthase [Synergistaceae bacterium]